MVIQASFFKEAFFCSLKGRQRGIYSASGLGVASIRSRRTEH